MDFRGTIYRALNPYWAREPLSGEGAARHGGRFNLRGRPALYTALTIPGVLREAHQAGRFQPLTLIAIEARVARVFDSRDAAALSSYGADDATLSDPGWRDAMTRGRPAPGQALAERLIAEGHQGMIVRSFAPGATAADLNLVLWSWGDAPPARLRVVDDEGRLTPRLGD
ncbi:RES domain-containing protein [Aquicoccus sp. SCR17]|nr:RES domain-containing protein [Carideicomes alvinocaridis]